MANFVVSYDLNGPTPTHKQMDDHIAKLGATRGRVLETVWYVAYAGSAGDLFDHIKSILGPEDRLLVVQGVEAAWKNLLINDKSLLETWNKNR